MALGEEIATTVSIANVLFTLFPFPFDLDVHHRALFSFVEYQCGVDTTYQNTSWPLTNALVNANGTCFTGWSGAPTRYCGGTGNWVDEVDGSLCTQNVCQNETIANATWPSTLSFITGNGNCLSGYAGAPTRVCQDDGTWSSTFGGTPCVCMLMPFFSSLPFFLSFFLFFSFLFFSFLFFSFLFFSFLFFSFLFFSSSTSPLIISGGLCV